MSHPAAIHDRRLGGTDGNKSLTCAVAVVLAVLLIAEGITIIRIGGIRALLVSAALGGGAALAIVVLPQITSWHVGRG